VLLETKVLNPNPKRNPCLEYLEGSWERRMKLLKSFNGRGGGTRERRKKVYKYPSSPELAVMWLLQPGRVTRLSPEPTRVARPLMPVHPVRLGEQG
jgi:hypothetical protein